MKIKLIHFLVVFGLFAMTCGNKTDMTETSEEVSNEVNMNQYQDQSTNFSEVLLTSQSSFGGVQSNLKATRKYELTLKVELEEALDFKRLLTDSIAIPFSALLVNGQKQSSLALSASSDVVKLMAYRSIYSTEVNVPQMVEVVEYEKTGLNLEKKAVVEYFKNGKPYYLEIDKIELKPNIYAP